MLGPASGQSGMNEEDHTDYWVYVFAKKNGTDREAPVKVGISRDVNGRMVQVQTSCPFKIGLVYVFECPSKDVAREIERCFHDTQKKDRLHGEWFNIEPITAIHLLCMVYRTLLEARLTDKTNYLGYLDVAGVLWAEKRFNLCVPSGVLQ
jgi:hypothetical protein